MMTLRALSEAQLCAVYRERMRRDFPESELKPLSLILQMRRAGVYDALGAYDGDELAAYALVYRRAGGRAPLLDYFAVEPSRRGRGDGSAALDLLKAHYAGTACALMIECEQPEGAPDEAQARARIRFYRHAGASSTGLRVRLFGVEFCILCLRFGEEALDCEAEMTALYMDMLTPDGFARHAHLRREETANGGDCDD